MKDTTYAILRKHYPEEAYLMVKEVSDTTGGRNRSLDFMILGLWPSRGIHLTGIEVKTWRADFLKELKNPEKQELHFKYCDFFYLLTDEEGVAKPEEIPSTWGWIHIDMKGKLKIMKEAPKLQPFVLTRNFLAAMMRRACDKKGWIRQSEIADKLKEKVEHGRELERQNRHHAEQQLKELREQLKIFTDTTGLTIGSGYDWKWNGKRLGEMVKYVIEKKPEDLQNQLHQIKNQAEKIFKAAEEGLTIEPITVNP